MGGIKSYTDLEIYIEEKEYRDIKERIERLGKKIYTLEEKWE